MLRAQNFRVDPRRIVHETIDDETIIIDLETGAYFSLRGSAPAIWALLVEGHSEPEVVVEMRRRYAGEIDAVDDATSALIARLTEERLIERTDQSGRAAQATLTDSDRAIQRFEDPVFEKYTDMDYFLLLDPIHEVEEGGWPRAATGNPPAPAG